MLPTFNYFPFFHEFIKSLSTSLVKDYNLCWCCSAFYIFSTATTSAAIHKKEQGESLFNYWTLLPWWVGNHGFNLIFLLFLNILPLQVLRWATIHLFLQSYKIYSAAFGVFCFSILVDDMDHQPQWNIC